MDASTEQNTTTRAPWHQEEEATPIRDATEPEKAAEKTGRGWLAELGDAIREKLADAANAIRGAFDGYAARREQAEAEREATSAAQAKEAEANTARERNDRDAATGGQDRARDLETVMTPDGQKVRADQAPSHGAEVAGQWVRPDLAEAARHEERIREEREQAKAEASFRDQMRDLARETPPDERSPADRWIVAQEEINKRVEAGEPVPEDLRKEMRDATRAVQDSPEDRATLNERGFGEIYARSEASLAKHDKEQAQAKAPARDQTPSRGPTLER